MRHSYLAALIGAAFIVTGCNELIAIDRFFVRDAGEQERDGGAVDGGAMDAGESDAGDDACTPTTSYADLDGDGHGDPGTATESCAPAEDRVTNSDDCDDGNAGIGPGTTEICDDADQDCDGAIDEGLIGPIGSWIEVVPDLGSGPSFARVLTHQDGVTVAWHTQHEDILRASFFNRDGVPLQSAMYIMGNETDVHSMSRFNVDGLDHVLFVWTSEVHGSVAAVLCSTSGACAPRQEIHAGGMEDIEDLSVAQLGERAIVRWTSPAGLHVASFDPRTGVASNVLTVPPTAGMVTGFSGLATIDGPNPHVLIGRYSAVFAGSMVVSSEAHLLRINGYTEHSFDESTDVFPWDTSERCSSLGRDSCATIALGPGGAASPGAPIFTIYEVVSGYDMSGPAEQSKCLFQAVAGDAAPRIGECIDAAEVVTFSLRGSVATVIVDTSVEYAVRDLALTDLAEGSGLVALPLLTHAASSIRGLSSRHAAGAIVAEIDRTDGVRNLSMLRLGCTP